MSIITRLAQLIPNDRLLSALRELETVYGELEEEHRAWIAVSPFRCPSSCGRCCEHFVPDVWEIEALYIAAQLWIEGRQDVWIGGHPMERIQWRPKVSIQGRQDIHIEERQEAPLEMVQDLQMERRENSQIDRIERSSVCPLYKREGDFHCTVYASRPLVCRVFGFSADRDKWGRLRYAPCRFMEVATKDRQGAGQEGGVQQQIGQGEKFEAEQVIGGQRGERIARKGKTHLRRVWTEEELSTYYPVLPPDMTLFGRRVEAIEPAWAGERESLDIALPKALQKLELYRRFSGPERAA